MSKSDYIQFIQQSRVVSRRSEAGLQAADVELLWLKCSKQAQAVKAGKTAILLPHQFMETVLRISAIKYEQLTPSVVERLSRMCLEDLRWNARQSDADSFRFRLVESDVLATKTYFEDKVKNIFQKFGRKGKMSMRQWKTFVDTLLLEESSKRFSSRHVENIFHKGQSGSAVVVVDKNEKSTAEQQPNEDVVSYEASVLDIIEFWECIGVISVFECPDPYMTLGVKIKMFLDTTVVPRYECYLENGEHGVRNFVQRSSGSSGSSE